MRRQWKLFQTEGAPTYVRNCSCFAVVPAENRPSEDLCGALRQVDGYCLTIYAKSEFAANLALTLERRAGAVDLGRLGSVFKEEQRRRRAAFVQGEIVVADGRSDPMLFGGRGRLLHDGRQWEADELKTMPVQIKRLKEMEAAGVDVVELPTNAAVDMKFAGLNLAQPVAICRDRFRVAESTGRVKVRWS